MDAHTTIELDRIGQDAAHDMVADLVGAPPGAELTALVSRARGNPLLIRELITGLREEGRLRAAGGQACLSDAARGVPRRVEALVRNRLSRLSAPCRQLLQVAALVDDGSGLCPSRLAAALRESTVAILPVLEEAVAACLLVAGDDELAFQSSLVRDVVEQTVPESVRSAVLEEVARTPVAASVPPDKAEPDQDQSGWGGLSGVERTIALLVSDGLTNRQIATRVFLSPHTINYYLRRIFRKLGIASRVELATLASEQRTAPDGAGRSRTAGPI
ncbi:LuxR C-terminal-related transcriptional regulator [Streptomyces sp. NPDC002888]|uniref:helix-turn-helix domain-containing protein n=1 Tax=Streptomyces sp. NPDC002888 TaxID=3364668 RepID=UPI003689B157